MREYARDNPKPSYGWFVKLNVVSTVSLMLVVASATAIAFVNAAFNELDRYLGQVVAPEWLVLISLMIGIFSVLGIEGTIVTVAMKEGLVKGERELESRKLVSSYLLLLISVIAGFYQRVGLVGNETAHTVTGWVLAFAGAFGTPFALMYAARLLGQLQEFERRFEASMEYEASQKELQDALAESERRRQAAEELAAAQQNKLLSGIKRGKYIVSTSDHVINVVPTAAPAPTPPVKADGQSDNGRHSSRQTINDYLIMHEMRLNDAVESADVARWYLKKQNLPFDPNLNTAIRTQLSRMRKEAGISISEN